MRNIALFLTYVGTAYHGWQVQKNEVTVAETLEQAGHLAADNMLEFLKKRVDMDPDELVMLMSLVCDLEVSQVVDPLLTARVALRKGIFRDLAF